jgi:hypothetical protein
MNDNIIGIFLVVAGVATFILWAIWYHFDGVAKAYQNGYNKGHMNGYDEAFTDLESDGVSPVLQFTMEFIDPEKAYK